MTDTPDDTNIDDKDFKARMDAAHDLAGETRTRCEHAEEFDGDHEIDLMPLVSNKRSGNVALTMLLADQRCFGFTLTQEQFEYLAHVFDRIRKQRREKANQSGV